MPQPAIYIDLAMIELVSNEEEYWEFVRRLRNHQQVKQGFIEQEEITPESHAKFMQKYGTMYYICLVNKVPAGFVGTIENDIRVATHPDFQQRGIGKFMINELMKLHPDSVAKVKIKNEASLRLFEACGFRKRYYILGK